MNVRRHLRAAFAALVILPLGLPAALSAQTAWWDVSRDRLVWFEVLRPEFEGPNDLRFTSSAWFAGGRAAVSDDLTLVAEVPVAYGRFKSGVALEPGEEVDRSTVGNPYLGLEWGRNGSPAWLEAGVRAPLASSGPNLGTEVGIFSDFVHRAEAFVVDAVPVTVMGNYLYRHDSGLFLRGRAGPAVWIAVDDRDETELLASYMGQVGYDFGRATLQGAYMGRALLTESDLSFREATFNQVGLAATAKLGRLQPAMQFRVPLDDDLGTDFVAGFGLAVMLR